MATKAEKAKHAALEAGDRIEWVIAAVSLVVVLGLMGYLTVQALTQRDGHPALVLEVSETHAVPTGTAVIIAVRNDGAATAASIEIEAEGPDGAMASATLDYVPADSWREVTLVFEGAVGADALDLRVLGYSEP